MTDQTTLHTLAEECEAHAQAWDQRNDPDGHAAAWDALHTLLTAAGASVEHLARVRPDLAPVAAEDIAAAYRRLAGHLTAVLPDHDAQVRADERAQRRSGRPTTPTPTHTTPEASSASYGHAAAVKRPSQATPGLVRRGPLTVEGSDHG